MIDDVIKGDLIKFAIAGRFDAIVHGYNCFNTMGKGIAKQIKNKFPEAYKADCCTRMGDILKLGTYTCAMLTIINAYIQYNYGSSINVNYDAIRKIFTSINKFSGKCIGRGVLQ